MNKLHIPVLLGDILSMAEAMSTAPQLMLDATFGRGGHSIALIEKFENLKVCGLDQDMAAIDYAKSEFAGLIENQKLEMAHGNFHNIKSDISRFENTKPKGFDLILADLGVSSPQLDEASRGFSFQQKGPLDMRMDRSGELTAKDIVNTWSEQELRDLFFHTGEVRKPGKVVSSILKFRKQKLFETTLELSELIAAKEGWRKKGQHPATKFFLALRIEVNRELEPLDQALIDLVDRLNPLGRLMVITFHSLEDRIAKRTFKSQLEKGRLVNKKVIQATWDEKKKNARARSAKLRVFEKQEEQNEEES